LHNNLYNGSYTYNAVSVIYYQNIYPFVYVGMYMHMYVSDC